MVKVGIYEVPSISKKFDYRVCNNTGSRLWAIFKKKKDSTMWQFVDTGYRSKNSAVEVVEEIAARENGYNPVKDHLYNIDDGIDLNNEGWDN